MSAIVGASISDVDTGALEGIAVTALNSGNGTWQYSIDDGASWANVGDGDRQLRPVAASVDRLRFVPDALNADSATVTYRAWDQTSGTQGTKVDTSTNGGTTAFSTATDTASITVTAVNDAPVLDNSGTPTLTTITEDETNNAGDLVSAILGASISDVDNGAFEGIAVTAVDNSNGTWQFSMDNGSTWTDVGAVADNSALLLRADRPTAVRARRAERRHGHDQLPGLGSDQRHPGSKVDASSNGGATAFSTATDTASITVTAVNDAPCWTTAASSDSDHHHRRRHQQRGDLVSAIVGAWISDVDNGALEGIAITAVDSSNGTWQFSIDGGSTWTDVGAVADNSALLLRATDRSALRARRDNADTASITFRAWDQTSGTQGSQSRRHDQRRNDRLQHRHRHRHITVTAVNDAPVLDNSGTRH